MKPKLVIQLLNNVSWGLVILIGILFAILAFAAECPTDCTKVLVSTPNPTTVETRVIEITIPDKDTTDNSVTVKAYIEDEDENTIGHVNCKVVEGVVECSF